jgi:hypothetical protein
MFRKSLTGALFLAVFTIASTEAWMSTTSSQLSRRYEHVRPLAAAASQKEISVAENNYGDDDKDECKNSDIQALFPTRRRTTTTIMEEESRRSMLHQSLLGTVVTLTSWMTVGGASAQAGDETGSSNPLAELDAIAAQIGRSSNYPNSISPLPTLKQTELELVREDARYNTPPPATTTTTTIGNTPSDLSQALQESQRRKNIEPRTHG